jgi:hypothetical protein
LTSLNKRLIFRINQFGSTEKIGGIGPILCLTVFFLLTLFECSAQPALPSFRGAELVSSVNYDNVLEIKLQVYYSSLHLNIPEKEKVVLIRNDKNPNSKTISLDKEIELIDVWHPESNSNELDRTLGMKSVLYTTKLKIQKEYSDMEIMWASDRVQPMISNIRMENGDAIRLHVHLNNSKTNTHITHPFLGLFPYLTVKGMSIIKHIWNIPSYLQLGFFTPSILNILIEEEAKLESKEDGLKNAEFNSGFSEDQPAGKYFNFNKFNKEIQIDSLPIGNYILPISINEGDNQVKKTSHQAFYIIQSIY